VKTVVVTGAYTLPAAVFGVAAGRLAQHRSRRGILLWTLWLKVLLYVALAVAEALDSVPQGGFLAFSALSGTLSAFTFPAWQGYERDVVPAEQLDDANAVFSAVTSAAKLFGAVAGGFLLTMIGPDWVFVLNSVTFLPLIVIISRTPVREHLSPPAVGSAHVLRDATRAIRSDPMLRRAFGSILAVSILVAPIAQLLPAMGAQISKGAHVLGMLTAALALGGMLVAWVMDRLQRRRDRQSVTALGLFIAGAVLVLLGVANAVLDGSALYPPVLMLLVIVGLTMSMASAAITSVVQSDSPPDVEGGIFALFGAIYTTVGPLGALALAKLSEVVDVYTVEAVCGLVLVAYALIAQRARARSAASEPGSVAAGPRDVMASLQPGVADLHHPLTFAHRRQRRPLPAGSETSPSP
jgi:MFS family permease